MAAPQGLAAARRKLDQLIEAAEGRGRYVDLELVMRRITADFPEPVKEGHKFTAGGVRFKTAASGEKDVPVVSVIHYASADVEDGAQIEGGGTFRARVVVRAGGRWDTLKSRFDGHAEKPRVFDLTEAQMEVAEWFAGWLQRFSARRLGTSLDVLALQEVKDVLSCLYYGDRGGGKTIFALWAALSVAAEVPGTVVMIVSASRTQSIEDVKENFDGFLPTEWGAYRGQPEYRWRLVNNSRIRLMTADAPEDLKQGDVDFAVINEAAKMDKRAFTYTLGRVRLRSGLVLLTSNPPTPDVPKGAWVLELSQEFDERKRDGKWISCVVFRSTSKLNAAVDQETRDDALDLMRVISPRIAKADGEGEMAPLGAKIIYTWDRMKHGRFPCPQVGDITREWTKRRYGRAFDFLAGVDFQDRPFIIASFWKIFGKIDAPVIWCVSDFTERGSEDDFLDAAEISGVPVADGQCIELTPETALWIGDSSAQWQDTKHRGEQARIYPPSFTAFKNRGFHIVPPAEKITPEAKYPKNPPYGVSLGQMTSFIARDRIHVSPLAQKVIEACRESEQRPTPSGARPEQKYAHAIDTVRYVAWYVEPPTRRKVPPSTNRGPLVSVSAIRR